MNGRAEIGPPTRPQPKARQQNQQRVEYWREERLTELNQIAEAKKPKLKDG